MNRNIFFYQLRAEESSQYAILDEIAASALRIVRDHGGLEMVAASVADTVSATSSVCRMQ